MGFLTLCRDFSANFVLPLNAPLSPEGEIRAARISAQKRVRKLRGFGRLFWVKKVQ
jgi:hypothetical protein